MIQHPQVQASGAVIQYRHPVAGVLRQARAAAQFETTNTSIRLGAPCLGEHNREILLSLGLPDDEIDRLAGETVIGSEGPAQHALAG